MVVVAGLTGCGPVSRLFAPPPKPVEAVPDVAPPMAEIPAASGQTAAALDQTTAADKAAALAPVTEAGRTLGSVVVTLGSPAEQGFWLKTALVTVPGRGRVVTAGGAAVAIDLLPGTGGALLSLAAYRALGLALTDVPELTVFAD